MGINQTPMGDRTHIAIFGKRNSGKSSLLNALAGQAVSIVSDVKGTTTDPVYKPIEIHGVGACVLIDTAGYDDIGELGELRIQRTFSVIDKTDIAIIVITDVNLKDEIPLINKLKAKSIKIIPVINKSDILKDIGEIVDHISEFMLEPIIVSVKDNIGIEKLRDRIISECSKADRSITAHLIAPNDTVMLVMPQDIQAPKGRLILPQVQTIRDLLDNNCIVIAVTADKFTTALEQLKSAPTLIICDSQVFPLVKQNKPKDSLLTSFSVLFARHKGDIDEFVRGANIIDNLKPTDKILIAEACTHNALDGDIARVKLPKLLRKKIGETLSIEIVSGMDFPENLDEYALIIHCGGCMFNRQMILSRIDKAKTMAVPITNYGIAIAKLTGILDDVIY